MSLRRDRWWGCVVLTLALACGCVGTEGGNPVQEPEIDGTKILLVDQEDGTTVANGEPGAVFPASAVVRYVNLRGSGGFVTEDVNEDGSFSFTINETSRRFRFRALNGDRRSLAVDLTPVPLFNPSPPPERCLSAPTDLLFDSEPSTKTLMIDNTCDEPVLLMRPLLRFDESNFDVDFVAEIAIAPNDVAIVEVTKLTTGPAENLLVFNESAGPFAVTLFAP